MAPSTRRSNSTVTGRFDVIGRHVRETPGPIRLGRTPPPRPARYVGKVTGGEMTLTVTLTDTPEEIGSFTLVRGSEGRIRKCQLVTAGRRSVLPSKIGSENALTFLDSASLFVLE